MTDYQDIRRILDADRQWELRQRRAERAQLRNWVILVMAVTIIVVGAVLWASNGTLRGL